MKRHSILADEGTVRAVLCQLVGEHCAWQFASRELPERQELFAFDSGAKLYRIGERDWVIRGYLPDGADTERALFKFTLALHYVRFHLPH